MVLLCLFPSLFLDTEFEKAHRSSSVNISVADVYKSQRFSLPLKGIIFKIVEVVLFLEHELQVIFKGV